MVFAVTRGGGCMDVHCYCTSCGTRSFQWCVRIHRSRGSDTCGTHVNNLNLEHQWDNCMTGHCPDRSPPHTRITQGLTWVLACWSSSSRECSCRSAGSSTTFRRREDVRTFSVRVRGNTRKKMMQQQKDKLIQRDNVRRTWGVSHLLLSRSAWICDGPCGWGGGLTWWAPSCSLCRAGICGVWGWAWSPRPGSAARPAAPGRDPARRSGVRMRNKQTTARYYKSRLSVIESSSLTDSQTHFESVYRSLSPPRLLQLPPTDADGLTDPKVSWGVSVSVVNVLIRQWVIDSRPVTAGIVQIFCMYTLHLLLPLHRTLML